MGDSGSRVGRSVGQGSVVWCSFSRAIAADPRVPTITLVTAPRRLILIELQHDASVIGATAERAVRCDEAGAGDDGADRPQGPSGSTVRGCDRSKPSISRSFCALQGRANGNVWHPQSFRGNLGAEG